MLPWGAEGTDISLDLLDCYSFGEGLHLCEFTGDKEREIMTKKIFDVLQTSKDMSRSLLDLLMLKM